MTPWNRDIELTERERAIMGRCAERVSAAQHKELQRLIRAVALIALVLIVGSVGGWLSIRHESVNRTNAIQASRVQVLTDNCQETNARNLDSLAKLNRLLPKHPNRMERIRTQSTKLLISALVPYRANCALYAHVRLAAP